MTALIYSACGFQDPHVGVLMERAKRLSADGHNVIFAHCAGCMDICGPNGQGAALTCAFCKFVYKLRLRQLSSKIKVMPIKRIPHPQRVWTYSNLSELRGISYRSVSIGYAALSTFITETRNSRPNFDNKTTRQYFDHLLSIQADMTDWAVEFLGSHQIDEIHIHTGRMAENRLFYDLAEHFGIKFFSEEFIGSYRARTDFKPISYEGGLPHSLRLNKEMAIKLWTDETVPLDEKLQISSEFYSKRRAGEIAGDRVYTTLQERGLLPEGFDRGKINIVVFNSSEDEFAAIGKDFDDYQLFDNQTQGIAYIAEHLPKDKYTIYVRVHPNLMRIKYDYVVELFDLPKKYENVVIIPPDSPVSTYSLMDAADMVVVFGSTAGAEACYAKKPVILLGPSFYYFLDVAYTPSKAEDVLKLLQTENLPAKDANNALVFAYFLLRRDRLAQEGVYYDFKLVTIQFMKHKFFLPAYAKLFGSKLLMKISQIVFTHGARRFGKWPMGCSFFHDPVYLKS